MIREYFLKTWHHWKILLKDPAYVSSLIGGMLMLALSLFVTLILASFNDKVQYVSVGDFILDRLPTYDLSILFDFGVYILPMLVFLYAVFFESETLPFALKTYGLLYLIRACFMVLTHIGPPVGFFYADILASNIDPFKTFVFKNDLFFSGHTAVPFLAYLLFKKYKTFSILMIVTTIVMAATVLGMHVHYSIDVFAALFITYGIYALSNRIFNQLNIRFKRIIALKGWASFQNKLKMLKKVKIKR